MKKGFIWFGVFLSLLLLLAVLGGFFWYGGGKELWRMVSFTEKMEDKVKAQQIKNRFYDNTNRGEVEGFVARVDDKAIYLWTMEGLKKYSTAEKISYVFYYDVCKPIEMAEGGTLNVQPLGLFSTKDLKKWAKTGDYVVVKVYQENKSYFEKLWVYNGNTYMLAPLAEQCEK